MVSVWEVSRQSQWDSFFIFHFYMGLCRKTSPRRARSCSRCLSNHQGRLPVYQRICDSNSGNQLWIISILYRSIQLILAYIYNYIHIVSPERSHICTYCPLEQKRARPCWMPFPPWSFASSQLHPQSLPLRQPGRYSN